MLETAPHSPTLTAAGVGAIDRWIDITATMFVDSGPSRRDAELKAQLLVAAMEGALLLARIAAASDRETIDFVRRQASQAKYVTSVCTGAFILGAAGLLRGRRATTHWAFTGLLPLVGATHEKARIVKDGNVITAGGVTSGIDFGLSVIAEIAGEQAARTVQLGIEYDPASPFTSGHPDRAPAGLVDGLVAGRYGKMTSAYRAGLEQIVRP